MSPAKRRGFATRLLRAVGRDTHRPIAVYCAKGKRSAIAADILYAAGFREIHNFGGLSGRALRGTPLCDC